MKKFREITLELLMRIEKDQGFSHLVINKEMKKNRINPKDEALLTQIVYGTLERKMTLDYYLSNYIQSNKKMAPWVRMLLRMSVYQMVYLDKVPDHAIIHEAVEIAKKKGHRGIQSLVNGVLRNIQRNGVPELSEIKNPIKRLSIETSHPEWLVKNWVEQYGFEITEEICQANLENQPMTVRVQPLRISREQAMKQLEDDGFVVEPSLFSKQGIIIQTGNILTHELFKQGMLTVQDQSSMLVGEVLNPKPGMTVLDACSAPGGKATHLAEKMNNEGTLYAHDLHKKKVELVDEKQKSLNLSIIESTAYDAKKLQEKYEKGSFDRILIDAPCSGLGVIRSKPEIKYEKTQKDIERLQEVQLEILQHVAPLLSHTGRMVYSTCTIEKSENEQVVQAFLDQNPEFIVDATLFEELPAVLQTSIGVSEYGIQLFPQSFGTDGFFITRLKKAR